jgi:hypothetical protein
MAAFGPPVSRQGVAAGAACELNCDELFHVALGDEPPGIVDRKRLELPPMVIRP